MEKFFPNKAEDIFNTLIISIFILQQLFQFFCIGQYISVFRRQFRRCFIGCYAHGFAHISESIFYGFLFLRFT